MIYKNLKKMGKIAIYVNIQYPLMISNLELQHIIVVLIAKRNKKYQLSFIKIICNI
jgi:hypothetical protein